MTLRDWLLDTAFGVCGMGVVALVLWWAGHVLNIAWMRGR